MDRKQTQDILNDHRRWAETEGEDGIRADLCWADLRRADLRRADLRWADLRGADLCRADLRGADLCRADLRWADLRGADLREAKNIPNYVRSIVSILPQGRIILWKKCLDGDIVKLAVSAKAKRSNATGRKCRVEYAKVLAIWDCDGNPKQKTIGSYDNHTTYEVGKTVYPDAYDEDWTIECGHGIHGFITREEAEMY